MAQRPAANQVGLVAFLERGSATSREIQDVLGLSQPTMSRLTRGLDWVSAASRLERSGMLSRHDAAHLRWLAVFGKLIANTDQHFGNISLTPMDAKNRFALAPVYDMLPMLYVPAGEEVPTRVFDPQVRAKARAVDHWEDALHWATTFWETAAEDDRISEGFRGLCRSNAGQLHNLVGGPRFL